MKLTFEETQQVARQFNEFMQKQLNLHPKPLVELVLELSFSSARLAYPDRQEFDEMVARTKKQSLEFTEKFMTEKGLLNG